MAENTIDFEGNSRTFSFSFDKTNYALTVKCDRYPCVSTLEILEFIGDDFTRLAEFFQEICLHVEAKKPNQTEKKLPNWIRKKLKQMEQVAKNNYQVKKGLNG